MKYLLGVCALWLVVLTGHGQSRHLIDLSGQPFDNPLRAGGITAVLDARPDRTSLGWVQVGLGNTQTPVDLKNGLVPALQQLLQPAAGPAAQPAYALRVHRLSVGEITTASSETGSVELVVDVLRPRPDGQYDLLWRAAEMVESKGMDVTSKHPANIVAALRACLQQFEAAGPASLPTAAVLPAEQAAAPLEPLVPLTPYPLQTDAVRRAGVFQTFDEFRRNAPSNTKVAVISITPRTGAEWAGTSEVEVYYVDEKGYRSTVRGVWGYSDGRDLYILYRRHYYQLTPEAGGFAFDAPSAPDAEAVMAGGLVGGVAGMAIASASTSGHRQEHHLSLLTGRISTTPLRGNAADAARAEEGGQEGQVVVYRRKPSPAVVDVYAGKRVAGGLTPEQGSVRIAWADRRNALRLCLRPVGGAGGAETCVEALPRPGETLYYEYVEGPGAPQLKAVPTKEGVFETRRADQRARLSNKQ